MIVCFDERVYGHETGAGVFEAPASDLIGVPELHPENAERMRNMQRMLERGPIAPLLSWHAGRLATVDELARVHEPGYIERVRSVCQAGGGALTGTTVLGADSWEPVLAAAGTALEAADLVLRGETPLAYALVRPPGHHAQPDRADGYCFFNHAALVAERARDSGIERVAIVDWDVHHGNGTQACFWRRGDVLAASIHMRTGVWGVSHEQSGGPGEIGVGEGLGRTVNVELGLGAGDAALTAALSQVIVPILRQFGPGLIVGACGQDASAFDPNGRLNVTMDGFRTFGRALREAADELCAGRMVLVQEGGYARTYAAYCLHATLEGVLASSDPPLADPLAYVPDEVSRAREAVEAAQSALSRQWHFTR